ncbi:hypothetical protein Leryth_002953 [Lithospermum erythrorhizon]|uniref:Prolamin-like domain-containing protein n=1 Tax=Lithospermum erythrorhizon TaxID=34254 RepID=A0AAV3PV43_LITER|nr:hypothetical protein Leryth_002953 [Lithospermum erythrorhizon]
MAYSLKLVLAMQIILAMFASSIPTPFNQESTLLERLKLDIKEGEEGGSSTCWDSMFELKSCTGEVVLFFLNGETYLGPSCCSAIRTIEHHCWPSMLGTLGYTSEEEGILRGYCDDSEPGPGTTIIPHQPTSPPPNATATPANE